MHKLQKRDETLVRNINLQSIIISVISDIILIELSMYMIFHCYQLFRKKYIVLLKKDFTFVDELDFLENIFY